MDASLGILVSSVEIIVEDVAVEYAPEPDADPVGDIQKLVPAEVGQSAQCAEYSRPFAHLHRVGLQHCLSSHFADLERHERVDVVVDIGQVHEGACVEQRDDAAEGVFFELGPADGPQALVLALEIEILRWESVW